MIIHLVLQCIITYHDQTAQEPEGTAVFDRPWKTCHLTEDPATRLYPLRCWSFLPKLRG